MVWKFLVCGSSHPENTHMPQCQPAATPTKMNPVKGDVKDAAASCHSLGAADSKKQQKVSSNHESVKQDRENSKKEQSQKTNTNKNKKGLRRRKSRGHGTLDEFDLENVKEIDVERMNMNTPSIKQEFGNFGALPVGSKRLWNHNFVVKSSDDQGTNHADFTIAQGVYKFVLVCRPKRSSWVRPTGTVVCKSWIVNKQYGYSKESFSGNVNAVEQRYEFDFTISEEECRRQPFKLHVELFTSDKNSQTTVNAQLHRIVDIAVLKHHRNSSEEKSSNSFERDIVVLDGEDQTRMIQEARVRRSLLRQQEIARKQQSKRS